MSNIVLIRKILILINKHIKAFRAFDFACDLNDVLDDYGVNIIVIVEGDGLKAYNRHEIPACLYRNPNSTKKKIKKFLT